MTDKQELKAVSLQIAVGIIGNSADRRLETYLPLAEKIERYLNPPKTGSATIVPIQH